MVNNAHIILGPDGEVIAVSGAIPDGVVDRPLQSCTALSPAIRAAGQRLVGRLRESAARVAFDTVADGGLVIDLVAIAALVVRRRAANLRELLPSKLAVLESQAAAAGVRLTVHVGDDVPPVVHIDAEKIAWAVTTLVGNALRYVQAPSRALGGTAIAVRATCPAPGDMVAIAIDDDGPGIPADTVRRLFTGDGLNVRGAGLSLLLVKDMMTAHGGAVDLRSRIDPAGHGTTIELTFPAQ